MIQFIDAMRDVFCLVIGLGAQQSVEDQVVVSCAATLIALVILRLGAKGEGMSTLGWTRDLGALALVVGFALAAEAAALLYVLPLCKTAHVALGVRIAAPVLGLLVLGAPLAAWILRGGYGKTLVSLLFALVTATMVIATTRAILGSVRGEFEEMSAIRDRKDVMDSQLNKR